MSRNGVCNYPEDPPHDIPDGTTYWQTAEHGDICDDCHRRYYLPDKAAKAVTTPVEHPLFGPMPPQRSRHQMSSLCCSFCGKSENDVALVTGPRVFICQECVELSYKMFECRHRYCHNRVKRSSGLCTVCDLVYNGGRGERLA